MSHCMFSLKNYSAALVYTGTSYSNKAGLTVEHRLITFSVPQKIKKKTHKLLCMDICRKSSEQ